MAYSIARLDNVDAAVDVLGGAPENPGLIVVHYPSSIEDTIDRIDKPDIASALIPSHLFGTDVVAQCRSSSSKHNRPSDGPVQVLYGRQQSILRRGNGCRGSHFSASRPPV